MIRVCGCDLGMKNFGLSIITANNRKYKIVHSMMLERMIVSLKGDITKEIKQFYKYFKNLMVRYRPKKLVAERFMVRGRYGGAIAECLSFMLGIIAIICQELNITFEAITSSAWKNSFQRAMGQKLDGLYKFLKPLPNHMIDSVLQATYLVNPTYNNWRSLPLRKLRDEFADRKIKNRSTT